MDLALLFIALFNLSQFCIEVVTFEGYRLSKPLCKGIPFNTLECSEDFVVAEKKNLEMSITCLYKCKIIKSCKNDCLQPSIMSVHSFKFSLIKQNWHVNNRQKIRQNSLVSEILLW